MGNPEITAIIIIFNLFLTLFIIGIVLFIKQYKLKKKEHLLKLKDELERHQKELLATQIEIQIQTMQHIGREIHDNIGQKLTLASIYTQQLTYENKAPQVNDTIDNISAIINQSLSDLRELSKSLTDNTIEKTDICRLLKNETKRINNLKISKVSFFSDIKNIELPYQIKTVLYRITQEFLQNSIKHSKCKNIEIEFKYENSKLSLSLKDDGKGFDITESENKGIGLLNIKRRTEMIKGKYYFESKINIGTSLTIEIPL